MSGLNFNTVQSHNSKVSQLYKSNEFMIILKLYLSDGNVIYNIFITDRYHILIYLYLYTTAATLFPNYKLKTRLILTSIKHLRNYCFYYNGYLVTVNDFMIINDLKIFKKKLFKKVNLYKPNIIIPV